MAATMKREVEERGWKRATYRVNERDRKRWKYVRRYIRYNSLQRDRRTVPDLAAYSLFERHGRVFFCKVTRNALPLVLSADQTIVLLLIKIRIYITPTNRQKSIVILNLLLTKVTGSQLRLTVADESSIALLKRLLDDKLNSSAYCDTSLRKVIQRSNQLNPVDIRIHTFQE